MEPAIGEVIRPQQQQPCVFFFPEEPRIGPEKGMQLKSHFSDT
jgi:hypothetical protein